MQAERKGFKPILFAAVVGSILASIVAMLLSPTGIMGVGISFFALAGVYALILEVAMVAAFEIAFLVVVMQVFFLIVLAHQGYGQFAAH